MKLSVCIPTYEMHGRGGEFLEAAIRSILAQSVLPHEIIVSDQSNDQVVEDVCEKWDEEINIKYYPEPNRGNLSKNLNNAVSQSSGDIVRVLCQDDWLSNRHSIEIELRLLKDYPWALASTLHWDGEKYYWHLIPSYRHDLHLGRNSIGSPSLLIMRREAFLEFDKNLVMLADCEFYKRMWDTHGHPPISKIPTVISRKWEGQAQNTATTDESTAKEIEYSRRKHEDLTVGQHGSPGQGTDEAGR